MSDTKHKAHSKGKTTVDTKHTPAPASKANSKTVPAKSDTYTPSQNTKDLMAYSVFLMIDDQLKTDQRDALNSLRKTDGLYNEAKKKSGEFSKHYAAEPAKSQLAYLQNAHNSLQVTSGRLSKHADQLSKMIEQSMKAIQHFQSELQNVALAQAGVSSETAILQNMANQITPT